MRSNKIKLLIVALLLAGVGGTMLSRGASAAPAPTGEMILRGIVLADGPVADRLRDIQPTSLLDGRHNVTEIEASFAAFSADLAERNPGFLSNLEAAVRTHSVPSMRVAIDSMFATMAEMQDAAEGGARDSDDNAFVQPGESFVVQTNTFIYMVGVLVLNAVEFSANSDATSQFSRESLVVALASRF